MGLEDTLLRIASEPPAAAAAAAAAGAAVRPPPPPPLRRRRQHCLHCLELAEGAAGAEDPGEALCKAEYLGSTCRLPPCGMLNACLLFKDIIIIFPGLLGRRSGGGTHWLRLLGPLRSAGDEPKPGKAHAVVFTATA